MLDRKVSKVPFYIRLEETSFKESDEFTVRVTACMHPLKTVLYYTTMQTEAGSYLTNPFANAEADCYSIGKGKILRNSQADLRRERSMGF